MAVLCILQIVLRVLVYYVRKYEREKRKKEEDKQQIKIWVFDRTFAVYCILAFSNALPICI